MKEVEVKVLDIKREKVEKKLRALGAIQTLDSPLDQYHFECPHKTLRLRTIEKKTILTLKHHIPSDTAKVNEEWEVEVGDFHAMRTILQHLGFKEYKHIQKHRTSYSLGPLHFEFDKYKGENSFVPEFLEIEAKSIGEVFAAAELLGISSKLCIPWDSFDVITYYDTYWRIEVDDRGIYEAVNIMCPKNDARRVGKPDGSWLHKVGEMYPQAISFWTKAGWKKYQESGLYEWHCSVVEGPIRIITATKPHKIHYQDKNQIILLRENITQLTSTISSE